MKPVRDLIRRLPDPDSRNVIFLIIVSVCSMFFVLVRGIKDPVLVPGCYAMTALAVLSIVLKLLHRKHPRA